MIEINYPKQLNCGIKIYRKEVINSINLYGEMHRYIPLIAKWNGYKNIAEIRFKNLK